MLVGICGTDGSLLDLLQPLPGEYWAHLEPYLMSLLEDMRRVHAEAGYTPQEAQPV